MAGSETPEQLAAEQNRATSAGNSTMPIWGTYFGMGQGSVSSPTCPISEDQWIQLHRCAALDPQLLTKLADVFTSNAIKYDQAAIKITQVGKTAHFDTQKHEVKIKHLACIQDAQQCRKFADEARALADHALEIKNWSISAIQALDAYWKRGAGGPLQPAHIDGENPPRPDLKSAPGGYDYLFSKGIPPYSPRWYWFTILWAKPFTQIYINQLNSYWQSFGAGLDDFSRNWTFQDANSFHPASMITQQPDTTISGQGANYPRTMKPSQMPSQADITRALAEADRRARQEYNHQMHQNIATHNGTGTIGTWNPQQRTIGKHKSHVIGVDAPGAVHIVTH